MTNILYSLTILIFRKSFFLSSYAFLRFFLAKTCEIPISLLYIQSLGTQIVGMFHIFYRLKNITKKYLKSITLCKLTIWDYSDNKYSGRNFENCIFCILSVL